MRYVTVQVQPEAADDLQRGEATDASQELFEVTRELGVELAPMHPGVEDPELATYYRVEAPDDETAARVVDRLQGLKAVGAAYVKPRDAPP